MFRQLSTATIHRRMGQFPPNGADLWSHQLRKKLFLNNIYVSSLTLLFLNVLKGEAMMNLRASQIGATSVHY